VSPGARLALALVGLVVGTVGVILVLASETPRPTGSTSAEARVEHVVDGDTLVIGSGEHVRLIGIDTPERDTCGYREASEALRTLVAGRRITLVNPRSVQDEDGYGRLLRYVDRAGKDVGYDLLRTGLAVARYDSRDGKDHHPREERYRAADQRVASLCN
jgi:endonuclease YncB( thermonuclease family)